MSTRYERARAVTYPIGPARIDSHVGIDGFIVKPPVWAGDDERRVVSHPGSGPVTLTVHTLGVVIRVDDKPVLSLNADDVEALGVALIKLSARL